MPNAPTFQPETPSRLSAATPRRGDIQGLRAIAVTLVVAFHAGIPLSGGFAGVDIFFVISGFVITNLLLGELARTGHISFRAFYERRIRRLLPALAVVTSFTLIAAVLLEPPVGVQQSTGAMARATSLFFANIEAYLQPSGYFGTGSITDPLLHMWSLGVEEQFYLFFPATILVVAALARRFHWSMRRGLSVALVIGGALSLGFCWWATRHHPEFAFFWLPARAWEFAAGALLAAATPVLRTHIPAQLGIAMGIAGLAVIVVASLVVTSVGFPGLIATVPVAGAALVIAGGTTTDRGAAKLLSTRPFTALGDMSYGWYLWHWPLVVFLRAAIPDASWPAFAGAAVSILPAWLSLRFLENPVRARPPELRRTAALATACIAIPLLGGSALTMLANEGWGSATLRTYRADASTNALADNDLCLLGGRVTRAQAMGCHYDVPDSKGLIVLAGDSHAAALSNGVVGAGNALGYDVQVTTASACAFTTWSRIEDQETFNCGQVFDWTMHRLLGDASHIRLVVISQASAGHVASLTEAGIPEPLQSWTRSVRAVLSRLSAAHIPTLLVLDVPKITNQPSGCRFGAVFPLDCRVSRAWVDALQGPSWRGEIQAAAPVPGASTLSLVPRFCTAELCNAIQNGQDMYYDNQHLDRSGSLYVEPQLKAAMAKALATQWQASQGL